MVLVTMVTYPKSGEEYVLGGKEPFHILKQSKGRFLGEEGEKMPLL